MPGTAMPRSHRGTGVSPVNDWAVSDCFWRKTKDPEGVQQESPGREPWVQSPDCGKP